MAENLQVSLGTEVTAKVLWNEVGFGLTDIQRENFCEVGFHGSPAGGVMSEWLSVEKYSPYVLKNWFSGYLPKR